MTDISSIVNLDNHPITVSEEYLEKCKNSLRNNSILQLNNFLLPESLKKIQNDISPFDER